LVKPNITLNHYQLVNNRICIVINSKMISHSTDEVSKKYLDFIVRISKELIKRGEKVLFLNHEGGRDWVLIKKIVGILQDDKNVSALNGLNGYEVKAVIGHCKLLISSRFHGVVSS